MNKYIILFIAAATGIFAILMAYELGEVDYTYYVPKTAVWRKYEASELVRVVVTGYNTVEWQTDSTPCIAASGKNICGREDVVACPRKYPLGTKVEIDNKIYYCEDRLARKYDNRIDISFDKDVQAAINWGKQVKLVKIYGEVE